MEPPKTVTARFTLGGGDWKLSAAMTIPAGPTRIGELLSLAQSLSDAIVGEAVKAIEKSGGAISCRAGCGACCRHLVAISEVEARRLRVVVEAMPEPRQSEIRARFTAARRQFENAGLLRPLRRAGELTAKDYQSLSEDYFAQRVACPFLENESCSIYEDRPITCREYLVTSSPEHCATPDPKEIRRLSIPLRVFNAVARWQVPPSEHFVERWVPLILALEWAQANPNDPPAKPGPELLRDLLDCLTGKD